MTRLRLMCLLPDLNGGGAERMMIYLLRGLDRERFDITLVLGRKRGQLVEQVPADIPVRELGRARAATSILDVARELRRGDYDVCFSMVSMNLAAVIARRLGRSHAGLILGARSTYTTSIRTEAFASGLKLMAVRLLYPHADLVVSVSEGVKDDLVRNVGVPAAKIMTIYNPIDLDLVRRSAAVDPHHPWLDEAARVPVLVAVGALRTAKGYPDLLEAFRALRQHRDARLLILGEGPLRGSIERRIDELGLARDIALLGFQSNPYQYISRSTLFVHAALWEGFPNVLVEARACGVPVVATDCVSGPSEIVHSGEDGILVPVGAPAQLATAIGSLLDDPARRALFAERGSRDVERFSAASVLARYADAFVRFARMV